MFSHLSGYFTHVTTLAEVKEQVLKYIPVMARPMVMYRNDHPVRWTGVYADIEVGEPFYHSPQSQNISSARWNVFSNEILHLAWRIKGYDL